MTASLETLVVAAYVFADSLWIPRPGPPGKVTDEELIALAAAQAATGLSSDRQFLVELVTPAKHKLGQRLPGELAKARIRLVVESVFSNLKGQMRLEAHLAKTLPGLVHGSPSGCWRSPY
ncbi:MAG: hypothetical protein M3433_08630 [Actinomycetota bacterium]|nr:hypothetical protein [Actinomycetota bacterium]